MSGTGFEYIGWAPKQLAAHNLKPRESVLLLILAIRAGEDGISWYGTKPLAKQCSMSRDTLNQAIKGLERHGLLTHHNRVGQTSMYRLLKGGLTGTPDNPCPACADNERPIGPRDAAGRLTGTPGNPVAQPSLTGTPVGGLTEPPDTPVSGLPVKGLTGPPDRELPGELSKELPERTSTARDGARAGGGLPLTTAEQQTAARAWVERHRDTWPGIDDDVAISVYLAAVRRGQPPETSHVLYADRWGLDALGFCFPQEEAA